MNSPGNRRQTSSAVVHPMSSFKAVWIPNSTSGSMSVHLSGCGDALRAVDGTFLPGHSKWGDMLWFGGVWFQVAV